MRLIYWILFAALIAAILMFTIHSNVLGFLINGDEIVVTGSVVVDVVIILILVILGALLTKNRRRKT